MVLIMAPKVWFCRRPSDRKGCLVKITKIMMRVMMLPGVHHLALLVLVHRVELESELSSIVHLLHHHTSSHHIIYHIIIGTCANTEGTPSWTARYFSEPAGTTWWSIFVIVTITVTIIINLNINVTVTITIISSPWLSSSTSTASSIYYRKYNRPAQSSKEPPRAWGNWRNSRWRACWCCNSDGNDSYDNGDDNDDNSDDNDDNGDDNGVWLHRSWNPNWLYTCSSSRNWWHFHRDQLCWKKPFECTFNFPYEMIQKLQKRVIFCIMYYLGNTQTDAVRIDIIYRRYIISGILYI